MSIQQKSEELNVVEMNVCIYELEQGPLLREEDDGDVKKRLHESLIDCLEKSAHHEYLMSKTTKDSRGSYVFTTNDLCMRAGYTRDEEVHPSTTITKIDEDDINIIYQSITQEQNQIFVPIRE